MKKKAQSEDRWSPKETKHDRGHRISGKYHMYKGDFVTAFTRGALVIIGIILLFAVMLLLSLLFLRYALLFYLVLELIGVVFSIRIV